MRAWNELVAALGDVIPVPLLALLALVLATVVALLWYWWPEWWRGLRGDGRIRSSRWRWPKWRWPRLGWLRFWRRRRRRAERDSAPVAAIELRADELPELPARALALSADDLAARGRYKEAVRERLRAIVRDLVERGVVENRPGWTVTELAELGGRARPPAAASLRAATDLFSRIWYAQRPATAPDDVAMREYAERVRQALEERQVRV